MMRTGVAVDVTLVVAITEASRRQALMLSRWLAADARVGCAKQGRPGKTALVWILGSTVVRFLDLVQTEREKIYLVTMEALCFFIIAQ
jgi:hypothetical protein